MASRIEQLLQDLTRPSTTPGPIARSESPFEIQDTGHILTTFEELYGAQSIPNTGMHLARIESLPIDQMACDPEIIISQAARMQRERDAAIQERNFKDTQLAEVTAGRDRAEHRCHELYTVLQAVGQERKALLSKYNWLHSQLVEKGEEAKRILKQQWDEIRRYRSQCDQLALERDQLKREAGEYSARLQTTESQLRTVVEERDNLQGAVVQAALRLTNTALQRDQLAAEAKSRLSRFQQERDQAVQQRDEAQAALADLQRRFDDELVKTVGALGLTPEALDDLIVTRANGTLPTLEDPPDITNETEPVLSEPNVDVKLEEVAATPRLSPIAPEEPPLSEVAETASRCSPSAAPSLGTSSPKRRRKSYRMDCVLLPAPRRYQPNLIRRRKMRIVSSTPD